MKLSTGRRPISADIASMVDLHSSEAAKMEHQAGLAHPDGRQLSRFERLSMGHTLDPTPARQFSRADLRMADIGRLIDYRHGGKIPENDDPANGYVFLVVVTAFAEFDDVADARSFILRWLDQVASWWTDRQAGVDELLAKMNPRKKHLRDRAAGVLVNLKASERAALKIRTLSPADLTSLEFVKARKDAKRLADRERDERKRRDRDAKVHVDSVSRAKPWLIEGCSRATWYRRKQSHETENSHGGEVSTNGRETENSPLIVLRMGCEESVSTVAGVPSIVPDLLDLMLDGGGGISPPPDHEAPDDPMVSKQRSTSKSRVRPTPGRLDAAGLRRRIQMDLFVDGEVE